MERSAVLSRLSRAPFDLEVGRDSVSFADVVNARAEWKIKTQLEGEAPDAEDRYHHLLRRFQESRGAITEVYWAVSPPVGVAVTAQRRRWRRETLWLHRTTEALAWSEPEFSRILLHVDRQAVRVSNVLSGMGQRMAMSSLFALTRDVVMQLERRGDEPSDEPDPLVRRTLQSHKEELADIEEYAGQAAARQAQIIYLQGMVRGLIAILVLAPLLSMLFTELDVPGVDPTLFVACLIAGSFGALVSVLTRMGSEKFSINHEIGREYVTNLGFARPFIGAIFALLIYFAFQGQLLEQIRLPEDPANEFAFFVASGFLIGFSERLAKDLVVTTEAGIGGLLRPAGASETRPSQEGNPRQNGGPGSR